MDTEETKCPYTVSEVNFLDLYEYQKSIFGAKMHISVVPCNIPFLPIGRADRQSARTRLQDQGNLQDNDISAQQSILLA